MAYKDIVTNSVSDNNVKLTADKIIKDLDQLREEGKKSKRRWIWELMQNAKDVPNRYGEVSIDINLTESELVFAHNGNPFKIDNLTGLVQQVSSKHSENEDKNVTGKFGTGFIATHLLSEVVRIEGILKEKDEMPLRFSMELDRSGGTSEALMPSIKDCLVELNNIDSSNLFAPYQNYEQERREDNCDNKFVYSLTDATKKIAEIGLTDLISTLPKALVFLNTIKKVRINNAINQTKYTFSLIKSNEVETGYKRITVEVKNENDGTSKEYFYILKTNDDIQLLAETKDDQGYELIPIEKDQTPFLYRDFPLIGSEGFYFPFILNGKTLKPTERRDSIFLNGNSQNVKHNREILEKAIKHSLDFVDFLIKKKGSNLYAVCLSSIPKYSFDEESDTLIWYQYKIQSVYRQALLAKTIIDKDHDLVSLQEVRFPITKEKDSNELLKLITEFLGKNMVPEIPEQEKWSYYLGPEEEMSSWKLELVYTIDNLATDIELKGSLQGTSQINEPIQWMNRFYKLIEQLDRSDLFHRFKIVPNKIGDFRKFDDLSFEELTEEDGGFLPDPFLLLLKNLGIDWNVDLIHRSIKLQSEGHSKRSMSDLNTAINNVFREENFLQNEFAIPRLIEAHSIVAPNSKEDSLQRQILQYATKLFGNEIGLIHEEFAAKFNYEIVHRLLIQRINNTIENCFNVAGLAEKLGLTEQATIFWLDRYLKFLESKTDYSKFLKEGKIIPNRTEEQIFCKYDDLMNYGDSYQPLNGELIKIYNVLSEQDHFKYLVADGIGIKLPNSYSFSKLGNDLEFIFEKIQRENNIQLFRNPLLELVEWMGQFGSLANKYFNKLYNLSGRLFYILAIEESANKDSVMKILKAQDYIEELASISENPALLNQVNQLSKLFPEGIPSRVLDFAKEEAKNKKEFNNLLEVGSKVEKLLIETLEGLEISSEQEEIIYAGGGAYDIRVHNPLTKKSFYIELKSCRNQNVDPINIAISQAKRAVRELPNENYAIVVLERTANNEMDTEYIKSNAQYFRNPGEYLSPIVDNYLMINSKANTPEKVDLKMDYAQFKGTLDYSWIKEKVAGRGFNELITDIKRIIS